jgi:hypothetical protein
MYIVIFSPGDVGGHGPPFVALMAGCPYVKKTGEKYCNFLEDGWCRSPPVLQGAELLVGGPGGRSPHEGQR